MLLKTSESHSVRGTRPIGVTKKMFFLFFPESVSYFAPNSASMVMTQHAGQLQHIVNVSSNCVRFLHVQQGVPKFGLWG